jgi:hypothetical protein
MSPTNLSRRALVRGAAVIPAVAVLPAAAFAADNPDAELLELGAELDAIIPQWHAQRAIDAKSRAAWKAACEAAGLPDIEYGSVSADEWRAHFEKRCAIRHANDIDETDDDGHGGSIAWNRIGDLTWPLIDAITELAAEQPPQTLAGLAVLARTMTLSWSEFWDPGYLEDGDTENGRHRTFIEAVCAFAGVKPVPEEVQS